MSREAIRTVAEVREYAMSMYEQGGDIIIECWEDEQIEEFIAMCDKKSVRKALDSLFRNTKNDEWASQFD